MFKSHLFLGLKNNSPSQWTVSASDRNNPRPWHSGIFGLGVLQMFPCSGLHGSLQDWAEGEPELVGGPGQHNVEILAIYAESLSPFAPRLPLQSWGPNRRAETKGFLTGFHAGRSRSWIHQGAQTCPVLSPTPSRSAPAALMDSCSDCRWRPFRGSSPASQWLMGCDALPAFPFLRTRYLD